MKTLRYPFLLVIATIVILLVMISIARSQTSPAGRAAKPRWVNNPERWQEGDARRARYLFDELFAPLPDLAGVTMPNATTGPSVWTGGAGNWSDGAKWNPSDAPNSAGADVSVDGGNAVASVVSVNGDFTVGRLAIDAGDTVNILDIRSLSLTDTGGFSGAGSMINNGNLTLTTGGNITRLNIDGAISLSGSGAVTLIGSSGNSHLRGGGTLTNASTIQGEGNVGVNETGFVNQASGLMQASISGRVLTIDPSGAVGMSNSGILRATGGGFLQLTGNGGGDFTNTASGRIEAQGVGSQVQLHTSAKISGGTLATSDSGLIRTLNGNTVFLDALTNSGDFLGSDNSTTVLSGTINNLGNIRILTAGNLTNLRIDSAATLTGAGTVTLDRDPVTGSSNSRIAGSGTLTNASTIQGEGSVGSNESALINQSNGIIQANVSGRVLTIDPNGANGLSNAGVLRANSGGILQLTGNGGGDFTNTGGGNILADGAGSEVQLHTSATIHGGTLSTANGGIIRTLNGNTAFLDGLTNAGNFVGSDNSSTVISGTINNAGNITLTTNGNLTNLRIDSAAPATLAGAGTLTLTRNAAQTGASNARIAGAGTFTNQSTIQGEGFVGANETTITNDASGVIQANVAGRGLQLDPVAGTGTFVNQGLLRAIDGGVLQLTGNGGGTFNNSGGTIRAEAGSEVQLFNSATISGGTLSTVGTGALLRTLNGNTVTLDNLTIAGTYTGSDNSTTILTGAINNTGDITITTDGNFTNLRVDGSATLQAGGTVTLTRNAAQTTQSNARISGSGTLTNASTIQGEGNVGSNETTIVNQSGGIIQANVLGRALTFDAVNVANGFSNAGVLRATNGGVLQFTGNGLGDFTNTGAGTIRAVGAGSEVQLTNGATIRGGSFLTSDGGLIRTVNGQSVTLDTLTNSGDYLASDNSSTFLVGSLINTGNFTVTTNGNFTDLRIDGNVSLSGLGTVTLTRNAAATGSSNARIRGPGTLTNASTIQGEGFVGTDEMFLVNQAGGLIQANVAGRALIIDPAAAVGSYSNSGILRAFGGGVLQLSGTGGGDFVNAGAGTIQAVGAGSEVQLINNAIIRGGTLISSEGGLFRLPFSQTGTLDSVNNPGNFIANDNSTTFLVGTINNTGDMAFTTNGNFTNLRIDGAVTLTGSGTVTLTRNASATGSSNALLRGGGTLTNASTVQGEGSVGLNETSFVNQSAGVIQANVAGRSLQLDPAAGGGLTNAGALRASNGGTLQLNGNGGGSFTNNIGAANGIFEARNGSLFTMDASAILTNNVGGVLTGGSYRAISSGAGATITIRGANITEIDENTEVILSGTGSIFQVGTTALQNTLTVVDGALRVLVGQSYTNANALSDEGVIQLGGGTFNAPSLTITSAGELFGFGSIALRPTNSGLIRSNGGTLAFANGIQGGSGTVQTDIGSMMNLSSGNSGSDADFLINNGSLALGTNNFTVGLDYTNANFGSGNSFNPRANVTGAGSILALGNVGQTLTGVGVANGATTAPSLDFGNVHVGDTNTVNYRINNTGTSGPALRGALQTSVNAGNLTDLRLIGTGVTAGNFGPLAVGDDTDDFAVTFNATSAGALAAQVVHIINNFDNVADQNLSITGAAFRFANPTAHMPEPIAFGNFHVGDLPPSQVLSITNNVPDDGFSEALNATIGGATGGVTTNGGMISLLGPGDIDSTSLLVGISTAAAGNQSGTATITLQSDGTGSSGLGITNLTSQTVNITGSVFRFAAPSAVAPSPVVFTNRHVGDLATQLLTVSNQAANDGFSEALDALFSSMTGDVTTAGTISLLTPGASNSTSLLVGLDTSMAGARSGTATIGFTSNGMGTSGLGTTALTAQTINVSGNVYRFANPTSHTPEPVNFGNFHVGDVAPSQMLSLTNNVVADGFSESLDGSIGTATGGVTTNGGSFTGLAPGTTSNDLSVGISTASAGNQSGTATITLASNGAGSSGLGVTALPSQIVNVTGAVYRLASPTAHSPEPVAFGIVHVGDAAPSQALSLANNVPADSFSETLNATIGGATGGVTTNGGSITVAPAATNSTGLSVGISTATAGLQDGTATITLASDGTGSSNLGLTNLTSQTVNVTGQVNHFADPILFFKSGAAILTMISPTEFTLDFGQVAQDSGVLTAAFGIRNTLLDLIYQDALGGGFDLTAVNDFLLDGFDAFSGIAPGEAFDPDVMFDSSKAVGSYSDVVFFNPTSANASTTDSLAQIQLNIQGQVIPEPGTWAMIIVGGGMLLALQRARRRSS